jgi:WD40 repeat protein
VVTATNHVWDAATGQQLFALPAHRACEAAFSPDGGRLVSWGQDSMVRVWDATTGKKCRTLSGHTAWVRGAAFSPDGRRLVSWGSDPNITR